MARRSILLTIFAFFALLACAAAQQQGEHSAGASSVGAGAGHGWAAVTRRFCLPAASRRAALPPLNPNSCPKLQAHTCTAKHHTMLPLAAAPPNAPVSAMR
jgi:hypothetical protein